MVAKRFESLHRVERPRISAPDNVRLRLQRNEKPNDWPEDLLNRIFSSVPKSLLQRYPEPSDFYAKLAKFLGTTEKNLILTSGIDEPIRSLITLYCEPGETYAAGVPGYAMYSVYADILGAKIAPLTFDPTQPTDPNMLLALLPAGTKILFLPNPGQPVENCFDLMELRQIALGCRARGILFVVDEAYHYFGAPSAMPLIAEFDHVLIMRTFSKAFGAASVRLGFVMGSHEAIRPLAAYRLAHEANALSLYVAGELLDAFESHVMPSVREICAGRDFLRAECRRRNFDAWGEFSNNVLIDLGDAQTMGYVVDALADQGIYVKGRFPAPCDRHILVTCGPQAMMQDFLNALSAAVETSRQSAGANRDG